MQRDLFDNAREEAARDAALANLEQFRAELIAEAKAIAISLADRYGEVTSTQVFDVMKHGPMADLLDLVDPRWMGAVFRKGWEKIGHRPEGSHKRDIAVWRLKE